MKVNSAKVDVGASAEAETTAGRTSLSTEDITTPGFYSQAEFENAVMSCDHPIPFSKELATILGLNEAIFLQELHYWVRFNRNAHNNFHDGRYWTYNTYDGWKELLPFWGKNTIRRTIEKLVVDGIVLVGKYNKLNIDRTKWYSIDYKALYDKICSSRTAQNGQYELPNVGRAIPPRTPPHTENMNGHSPAETDQEASSGCSADSPLEPSANDYLSTTYRDATIFVHNYVDNIYPSIKGIPHPNVGKKKYAEFADSISAFMRCFDFEVDALEEMFVYALEDDENSDGSLYLYTTNNQLGYWAVRSQQLDVTLLRDTPYDYDMVVLSY